MARDGTFTSPLTLLEPAAQTAHVRWLSGRSVRGHEACGVLAASREEGFALRERLDAPRVREGIGLLLLENPYYGACAGRSASGLEHCAPSVQSV